MRKALADQLASLGKPPNPLLDIELPPLDGALFYLFHWFAELDRMRPQAFSGFAHLTWSDILAWCQIKGVALSDFERRALIEIDRWRCHTVNGKIREKDDIESARRERGGK